MRNKIFLFIVIVVILSLTIFAPLKKTLYEAGLWSYTDIGNVKKAEEPSEDDIISNITYAVHKAEAAVEDIYTNFLPYYNDVVMLTGEAEYGINDRFNSLFEDEKQYDIIISEPEISEEVVHEAETIEAVDTEPEAEEIVEEQDLSDTIVSVKSRYIANDGRHLYYAITAKYGDGHKVEALDRVTACTEEELDKKMKPMKEEMVRIVSYLSEVTNVAVFAGARFQDFPVIEDVIDGAYSTGEDLEEFLSALAPYASTDYTKLDTVQARFDKMLLTDHHWNYNGADEGYRSIVSMLSKNYPEIGEPRVPTTYTVEGIVHNGSFSRLSNYYRITEGFSFNDYNLPEHKVTGGELFDVYKNYYLSGKFDNSRGVAHYEGFYPAHSSITYPDNDTGHNLLVIGDSFSRAVNEVLASHFDHTYIRQYYTGGTMDLQSYIKRYKITDVVILIYSDRLMYNLWDDFNLSEFVTP